MIVATTRTIHPLAGEIYSSEVAIQFGYFGRIGKISNQGVPVYSAYFKKWLLSKQGGRCGYCGRDILESGQIDHIVPRSSNGSNLPPNLIYACGPCNSGKCNRTIEDVRHMLRVRHSNVGGIITPKQARELEAVGIDLGLQPTFQFLCEREGWDHVQIPQEALQ